MTLLGNLHRSAPVVLLFVMGMSLCGCQEPPPSWPDSDWTTYEVGAPLPGLSPAELARWQAGYAQFIRIWTVEEGLGPAFNENSCNACHSDPTVGGTMTETDAHATAYFHGTCDYLLEEGGGNLRRQMTELGEAYYGQNREPRPPEAAEVGRHLPALLFGRGLMASIPQEAIFALEDPDDADGDGISGRAGRYPDGSLARFFRKAELATLYEIADKGLRRQMGITTPNNPIEHPIMGQPVPAEVDPTPDPEVGPEISRAMADYILLLGPPPTIVPSTEEGRAEVRRGKELFEEIGCAACHTPVLLTGPNEIEALDRKTVWLWSDLLLHDMGPALADVCGPEASPSEYRTARLWGLRYRSDLLHDGRARTPEEAIASHGGEALGSRTAYSQLTEEERALLLRFLASL